MEITMEQVKKLQEHADVSFREAKEALEEAGGNLLDALIALEAKGKAHPGGGSFRTDRPYAPGAAWEADREDMPCRHRHRHGWHRRRQEGGYGKGPVGRFWDKLCELIHKGNVNHFEVRRNDRCVVDMPVNLLIVTLVFFFWVVTPALVVALFFGCRYRLRGPDLEREILNKAMDKASETAENIKRSVRDGEGPNDGENSAH
ncbi:MAG: DUF4342 domain-containing protein [Gracilibacteraceae bacterium]|nr:DUF4342 domain-containing protein [Gracilibacteraceae bacterium]